MKSNLGRNLFKGSLLLANVSKDHKKELVLVAGKTGTYALTSVAGAVLRLGPHSHCTVVQCQEPLEPCACSLVMQI